MIEGIRAECRSDDARRLSRSACPQGPRNVTYNDKTLSIQGKKAYHASSQSRVAGYRIGDPLTSGSAPHTSSRHRQMDARFIDERQAFKRN